MFVITIKYQITYVHNSQVFTSAIKLSLILVGVLRWTILGFFIMLHGVSIYATLYKNLCST
jgi:hypothetical protein